MHVAAGVQHLPRHHRRLPRRQVEGASWERRGSDPGRIPHVDTFPCAGQPELSSHKLVANDETTGPRITNQQCQELPQHAVGFRAGPTSQECRSQPATRRIAARKIAKVKPRFLS